MKKPTKTLLRVAVASTMIAMGFAAVAMPVSGQPIDTDNPAMVTITGTSACSPLTNTCDHDYSASHSSRVPGIGGTGLLLIVEGADGTDGCEWPDGIAELLGCQTNVPADGVPMNQCVEWNGRTVLDTMHVRWTTLEAPASAC